MTSPPSSSNATVANVDKSKSVDYPSLLPYEVLSHVFILCSNDPIRLPYDKTDAPCQVILLQVCSKWRQVAVSTGALWCQVMISDYSIVTNYALCLSLYRTWIDRAGTHPLTVALNHASTVDVHKVFRDFVLPFRIKMLAVELRYEDCHKLSKFPTLRVEEFAISFRKIWKVENFAAPSFINKTRSISFGEFDGSPEGSIQARMKELCLPWRHLCSLDLSRGVSLSCILNILQQTPSLEKCDVTINNIGTGRTVGVSMPSLRSLALSLPSLHPDIVTPLIATQNLTALGIYCYEMWSLDTYEILRKHHELHQLHRFRVYSPDFPLCIAQVLVDAPMIHELCVLCRPVLDVEALEGIASGRLGRNLSSLHLADCFDHTEEWLDMVEAR